jgi:AP-4 complex subunit mu-1
MLEVVVVIRADLPEDNHGTNVVVSVKCPRATDVATPDPPSAGTTADYDAAKRALVWTVHKFAGGKEHTFRARIRLSTRCTAQTRRQVGPVSLTFEIPMYNVSNLQVKYLRIADCPKNYNPYRWVRYVTSASSYVCRC